jgi:ABC-type nitrate/sulfonate/bicarbonate transport system ATPase subunit
MVVNLLEMDRIVYAHPQDGPILFKALNLSVPSQGHITCVLGRTGIGKSHLIQLALGERKPRSGVVTLNGEALPVLQHYESMLLPWFTALKNITLGSTDVRHNALKIVLRTSWRSRINLVVSRRLFPADKSTGWYLRELLFAVPNCSYETNH